MEAAAVAAAARAHGIAFRAVKAISDELDFEMPEMARFIDATRAVFRPSNFAAVCRAAAVAVAARAQHWRRNSSKSCEGAGAGYLKASR